MCKIHLMTGIKDSELAYKLAKKIEKAISVTQIHGFGYAAIDTERQLFSEKWLCNPNAWYTFNVNTKFYQKQGILNRHNMTSYIGHGRYATNEKVIKNTHPFERNGTYLVHNGVVDMDKLEYLSSTCDSEGILNQYISYDLQLSPHNTPDALKPVQGWYACGVLNKQYMDVFKESQSQLYRCQTDIATWMYCTCDVILKRSLDMMQIGHTKITRVPHGMFMRHDVVTGELIGSWEFSPTQREYKKYDYSNYRDHWRKYDDKKNVDSYQENWLLKDDDFAIEYKPVV